MVESGAQELPRRRWCRRSDRGPRRHQADLRHPEGARARRWASPSARWRRRTIDAGARGRDRGGASPGPAARGHAQAGQAREVRAHEAGARRVPEDASARTRRTSGRRARRLRRPAREAAARRDPGATAAASTAAASTRSGPSPARWACFRAPTARPSSRAARPRPWSRSPWAPARTPRSSTGSQEPESRKRFMLHYNFPPFSVGEVKFLRGPGRREIGHGALAERALRVMLPDEEAVPLHDPHRLGHPGVERVVLHGLDLRRRRWRSWTRACPSRAPVAGVAMGLVKEGEQVGRPLRHRGRGRPLRRHGLQGRGHAQAGITALQMDIKIGGITAEIMAQALEQARQGRLHILDQMAEALRRTAPRHLDLRARASSPSRSPWTRSATSSARAAR